MSSIVAPVPTTVFNIDGIRLTAVSNTNYNRSYSILRAPQNADLGQIVVEFTGLTTSTSRTQPLNGSHIYVALATELPKLLGDVDMDGMVTEADVDQNGVVDFLDIAPFIDILIGQ